MNERKKYKCISLTNAYICNNKEQEKQEEKNTDFPQCT